MQTHSRREGPANCCVFVKAMAEFHDIAGYEVLASLGKGARSTLYAVRDTDGHLYTLKRVVKNSPADQRFIDQAIHEHEIASKFDHSLLRRSYKLIRQRALIRTSEVLVLLEFIDGVTLEQHKPSDFGKLCQVCAQAAQGLTIMHEAGYVHADIKPNNIMLCDDDTGKLIDFGQSCEIGTVKQRIQGTPDYIAPEQVLRREITAKTDIFNLGATMYWLLTNRHVPTLIPKGQAGLTMRSDDSCPPPVTVDDRVPLALSNLVMDCIEADPAERPESMKAVEDRLDIAYAQFARQHKADEQDAALQRNAG